MRLRTPIFPPYQFPSLAWGSGSTARDRLAHTPVPSPPQGQHSSAWDLKELWMLWTGWFLPHSRGRQFPTAVSASLGDWRLADNSRGGAVSGTTSLAESIFFKFPHFLQRFHSFQNSTNVGFLTHHSILRLFSTSQKYVRDSLCPYDLGYWLVNGTAQLVSLCHSWISG